MCGYNGFYFPDQCSPYDEYIPQLTKPKKQLLNFMFDPDKVSDNPNF